MATDRYTPLQPPQPVPSQRLAPPQPPVPPEIEGFLKKLKRKTSSSLLSGSWNKRWFFVDPRRREFGYAASKSPSAPRSSVFLDDITAVVQFDDTHFQVESRTRNFFLCGESKASTSCWVSTLDEYRRKVAAFEKDKTVYLAACSAAESHNAPSTAAAASAAAKLESMDPAARAERSSRAREATAHTKKASTPMASKGEQSRESSASSLVSRSSSSSSSSGRSPDVRQKRPASRTDRGRERRERAQRAPREARRSPSPTSTPEPSPPRAMGSRKDRPADRRADERDRGRERDARGRGGRRSDRETWRGGDEDAEEEEEEEDVADGESVFETAAASRASRGRGGRTRGAGKSQSAYPSRGHVMQAWIDEDFD